MNIESTPRRRRLPARIRRKLERAGDESRLCYAKFRGSKEIFDTYEDRRLDLQGKLNTGLLLTSVGSAVTASHLVLQKTSLPWIVAGAAIGFAGMYAVDKFLGNPAEEAISSARNESIMAHRAYKDALLDAIDDPQFTSEVKDKWNHVYGLIGFPDYQAKAIKNLEIRAGILEPPAQEKC